MSIVFFFQRLCIPIDHLNMKYEINVMYRILQIKFNKQLFHLSVAVFQITLFHVMMYAYYIEYAQTTYFIIVPM